MAGSHRYDRDWPRRRRAARRGDLYDLDYDGGDRDTRASGYTEGEYRHASRSSSPPLYSDEFRRQRSYSRYRAAEPYRISDSGRAPATEGDPDTRWVADSERRIDRLRERDALWAIPSHRRRREPRGPWERGWRPDSWWHAIGPEPRADYDWAYEADRPERYGWTGETGRG